MAKLPHTSEYNQAKSERIDKVVEITLRHGEYNYIYLEFSNGERIRLSRPAIKE